MAATPIEVTTELVRDAIRSRVYVADALGKQWEEITGLYCDELRLLAAPGIDSALLHYDYGPMRREDADSVWLNEEPQDILGKYCKVVLESAGLEGEDLTWYGIIEVDDTLPYGSGNAEVEPRGMQKFTAFGLLRLLERVNVLSTLVDHSQNSDIPIESVKLEFGMDFNHRLDKRATWTGNRTQYHNYGNPNLQFRFSDQRTAANKWTANEAVGYLLEVHRPKDGAGNDVCDWKLADGSELLLAWYEPHVRTDGHTVKQVLDSLMPHRRGLSYRVEFDEEKGTNGTATLTPFSFATEDVLLPEFKSIAANDSQKTLNFENALDVEARIVDTITSSYDSVVAIGSFATSTCTLSFNVLQFQLTRDWTDAELLDYANAASTDVGYSSLDPLRKAERNTRYRQKNKLRKVFRRWKMYPWWDGLCWDYEVPRASCTYYYANPPWPEENGESTRDTDPLAEPVQPYSRSAQEPGEPLSPNHIYIEPALPLNDRCDYSDDRITTGEWEDDLSDGEPATKSPPIVFVRTDYSSSPNRYELLDRLAEQSSNENIRRRWSARAHVLSEQASIEINVNGAPQHFLAKTFSPTMAQMEAFLDPFKEAGIDFEEIRGTFCLRLPWRVQQRVEITKEYTPGRQKRTLYIPAEAYLDYVVPDTVVEITNGRPILTDGGFVRDDRVYLNEIANAAAEWYSTKRQTMFFRLTGVLEVVKVGDLITSVGGRYTIEDVNTPVTGVRYDLLRQTTEFETTFAEVEFT